MIKYSHKTLILFLTIVIYSCSTENTEIKSEVQEDKSDCKTFQDTLIWGMEPLNPNNTPAEFINIRKASSGIENQFYVIRLEMEGIPRSICYNNPRIIKGYSEFGLDVIFRNKRDSVNIDNIVISLGYNNFEVLDSFIKCNSFENFLKDCKYHIYKFKENLTDSTKSEPEFQDMGTENLDVYVDSNSIVFKIPIKNLCKEHDDYLSNGFAFKATYNKPINERDNNFYTVQLSSDKWIRHNFIYNSSRRIE